MRKGGGPSYFQSRSADEIVELEELASSKLGTNMMPADQMLCLIGSKWSLRLKAIVSHSHPAYRKKLDPNPTIRA